MLVIEFNKRCKRAAHFVTESVQWAHLTLLDERFNFATFELPSGNGFPQAVVTAAALEFLIGFLHDATAFGAGRSQSAEVSRDCVMLKVLGLGDHIFSHLGDLGHKLLP